MAKYLIQACYTPEGVKGLMKEGGSKRRDAAGKLIESVGAKMEAFYFAFGDHDAFLVVDAPDHATISAAVLAVNGSGSVRCTTVPLMTPEEVDQATSKHAIYRPPGG